MPNYKSLKTYSKTQKVVNYSTLFEKEPYHFDTSESEPSSQESKEPQPSGKKVLGNKENILPCESRGARTKKLEKNDEPAPIIGNKKDIIAGKRKPRIDYNESNRKNKFKSEKSEHVQLFQMSNMESLSESTSKSLQNDVSSEKRNTPKRTMKSSTSASSLKKSNNKHVIKENKNGGIKKSNSTANILNTRKIQLVQSDENRSDLVKEVKKIKSIMKTSIEEKGLSGPKDHASDKKNTRTKKAVKILVNIDDKNDQISNFKFDNRTKHAASTSTPSGLRRRPLKLPMEVSIIATPSKN